jgi:short-subunit dehydrogenase
MDKAAIIIGASKGLGKAVAYKLAEKGINCILAARNENALSAIAQDIIKRHNVSAIVYPIDLEKLDTVTAKQFAENCFNLLNNISQVYITAATVSDDDYGTGALYIMQQTNAVNYCACAMLVSAFSEKLQDRQSNITVISSIAAIRPRGRNLIYAASKIALEYHVKGLQHFFGDKPLRLQVYRVGYMDTEMTVGKKLLFKKKNPAHVARYITGKAKASGGLRYYPRYWRFIALLLKTLPWFIYKKLKF